MNLISAEKLSKSYSEKILFEDISFGISEGEKIGLIGVNGTGKSTLLKVIAGAEKADNGIITTVNGIRIEYLPQNPDFQSGLSVLEQVFKGFYLTDMPNSSLEKEHDYESEYEAKSILTKLGITDFEADLGVLSGGQKKRVAIAGALFNPADLLILDEPTNHIDNDTVDWMEKYLSKRKGALLMVTHDRYFLERVANRIFELDNGKLYSYQANYSKFIEMKIEREELEQASERKRRNLLREELEWIQRGARARSTKQKARIERFDKLKEGQAYISAENIEIKAGASRLGKKIIEMEHIEKDFPTKINIIKDFSYILLRDDRIGIIGPNGCGKSTLMKIIAGVLAPDRGMITTGETVKIRMFSQENEELDGNLRVIDYIREEAESIVTKEGSISAVGMLEKFLFPQSTHWTPIAKLSGGEKRRLYLLRLLMGAPNILLLDEPTNDLDIKTLTVLESYLDDFPGAVVVVSHDRYFLDRVCSKIFAFEGAGKINKISGNYSDYEDIIQDNLKLGEKLNERSSGANSQKSDKSINTTEYKKERPRKFSYKEQEEYNKIDEAIEELENKITMTNKAINEVSSEYELLSKLLTDKASFEKQLETLIERWTFLNELAEEIEKNKKGI